jgi:hypothetical protein
LRSIPWYYHPTAVGVTAFGAMASPSFGRRLQVAASPAVGPEPGHIMYDQH